MEVVPTTSWAPYILPPASTSGTAYLGSRICIFVASGAAAAEVGSAACMPLVLLALERLQSRFEAATGWVPPLTHHFRGRLLCEVDHLPNAAGLAHHGRGGFAVGPAFLRQSLDSFAGGGGGFLHHVFTYELCRNFISPEAFTPPFQACCETEASWGWLNQGFVNITGCLLLSEPGGAGFSYFGHTAASFRAGMEGHVLVYMCRLRGVGGAPLAWEGVFLKERLPWAPAQSLDNLYSGVLSLLFRGFGGARFLRGFFAALPALRGRLPAGLRDHRTAAENFALACCAGAGGEGPREWLVGGLGWPQPRPGWGEALEAALLLAAAARA